MPLFNRFGPKTSWEFGGATLAGMGGIPAPAGATAISGGTASGYSLTDGYVVPTSDGSADNGTLTFSGSSEVWTMRASGRSKNGYLLSGGYSVRTPAELVALPWFSTSYNGAGGLVLFRPGTYGIKVQVASSSWNNFFRDISSTLRFTSHEWRDRAVLDYFIVFANTGNKPKNLQWDNLVFFRSREVIKSETVQQGNLMDLDGLTTATLANNGFENFKIRRCVFASTMPVFRNVDTDTIIDDYLTDVIDKNVNGTSGKIETTARPYIYGISCSTPADNLVIEENIAVGLTGFMGVRGENVTIRRNHQFLCWGDFVDLFPYDQGIATDGVLIENNLYHDSCGDAWGVHPDIVQMYNTRTTGGDMKNVTVRGNIVFMGYESFRRVGGSTTHLGNLMSVIQSSAELTANSGDPQLHWIDARSGNITITLPEAASSGLVSLVRIDDTNNAVIIQRSGTDTITHDHLGSGNTSIEVLTYKLARASLTPSGGVWTDSSGAPDVQFALMQLLDNNSGLTYTYQRNLWEGNIFWSSSNAGIKYEYNGTGNHARFNTCIKPRPGDINGDGSIGEADGWSTVAAPSLNLKGNNTNVGYRNIFPSIGVASGSTSRLVENLEISDASIEAWSAQFNGTEDDDYFPILDRSQYYQVASDGFPRTDDHWPYRFQSIRETIATYALAKPSSVAATTGAGALGTTLTNGAYNVKTGRMNNPGPTIVSGAQYYAEYNTAKDITVSADKPVVFTITGGADSAEYSVSAATLTLAANTDDDYVVQVTATDGDGDTDSKTITTTVLPSGSFTNLIAGSSGDLSADPFRTNNDAETTITQEGGTQSVTGEDYYKLASSTGTQEWVWDSSDDPLFTPESDQQYTMQVYFKDAAGSGIHGIDCNVVAGGVTYDARVFVDMSDLTISSSDTAEMSSSVNVSTAGLSTGEVLAWVTFTTPASTTRMYIELTAPAGTEVYFASPMLHKGSSSQTYYPGDPR